MIKAEKKKISDLTVCYCVAPLMYEGKRHFLVASDNRYACLLFDEHGNLKDKIWDEPGGTMSMVQIPDSDGAFLAVQQFYSPDDCKEAKIVLCLPENGSWKITTVAELPYVHRFDILERNGQQYLLACCIRSDYEYAGDWRFPGMALAGLLPSLEELKAGKQIEFSLLKDGMLKNHGYCRHITGGQMTGLVTCEQGVFRFTPPAEPGEDWAIDQLISDPTSDALLLDFDGDGEEELLTLSPFHGDTLSVYHKAGKGYEKVWEYERKIDFTHAICGGSVCGKNTAIIGHRGGERNLLAVRYVNGQYTVEILDHDCGSANAILMKVDGKDVLVSANREINEVATYILTEK